MSSYSIIGLMSGTSMDGVDLSYGSYEFSDNEQCNHKVEHAKTYNYTSELLELLKKSKILSIEQLLLLDKKLGSYFAKCVLDFISVHNIDKNNVDAIASHGHTVFHQPEKGYTYQIGCGDTLAARTKIKVVNDFRQKDVIAGGQGAPLVPIGDKMLYSNKADAFLNIGGFCNVTILQDSIIAFDICPGNLPLNYLVNYKDQSYDKGGEIAALGSVNSVLLSKLNELTYYSANAPKSLGTEWLDAIFMPLIDTPNDVKNTLRTIVEHISDQIAIICDKFDIKSLFITGGGTLNTFLVDRIKAKTDAKIIIPDKIQVEFKEAIIFGLLGALYLDNRTNILSSVTGAKEDVRGGVLHCP